jgi:translation elongation factor EF-Ts
MMTSDDPWYARLILQIMSREGIMTTLVVGVIVTIVVFGWLNGKKEMESRQKVNEDMASAYKTNAETNKTNAETNKSVSDSVKKLAAIADQNIEFQRTVIAQHETLQKYVMDDSECTRQIMEDGTLPAREVRDMMEAATRLMTPIPAIRDAQGKVMLELLDVQKQVLQTLKEQSKNVQPPPSNGGASRS